MPRPYGQGYLNEQGPKLSERILASAARKWPQLSRLPLQLIAWITPPHLVTIPLKSTTQKIVTVKGTRSKSRGRDPVFLFEESQNHSRENARSPIEFTAEQLTMIFAVTCEAVEESGRPVARWT